SFINKIPCSKVHCSYSTLFFLHRSLLSAVESFLFERRKSWLTLWWEDPFSLVSLMLYSIGWLLERSLTSFKGKKLIPKLLKQLKIMLLSADELLNDTEEKQLAKPNMRQWLGELKQVLYEADRVMGIRSTLKLCESSWKKAYPEARHVSV
ncbi:hypothetical protein PanWU01x14_368950, partial [Parasponia andersonii]